MAANKDDLFDKLVDEGRVGNDKLLKEDEILEKEEAEPAREACSTKTDKPKKPCANCTCGLKEASENETATSEQSQQAKSSCGSCYLGDAFRCASCPYKGMPAFKPGEKVTIDTSADE